MSKEMLGVLIFGSMILGTVIYFIVLNVKHSRRQKTNPSAHRGEYQSQRGRVYDPGVSNRSNSAEWGGGAGTNLTKVNPAWGNKHKKDNSGGHVPGDGGVASGDSGGSDGGACGGGE